MTDATLETPQRLAAHLEHLRAFKARVESAETQADQGTLEVGAEIHAAFEERDWIEAADEADRAAGRTPPGELPPRRTAGTNPAPDSFQRFARFVSGEVGVSRGAVANLRDGYLLVDQLRAVHKGVLPETEGAAKPLKAVRSEASIEAAAEVWRAACDSVGGRPAGFPAVKAAVYEWRKEHRKGRPPKSRTQRDVERRFRADGRWLMKYHPATFSQAMRQLVEEYAELEAQRKAAEREVG